MSTTIPAWVNGKLKPVDKMQVHLAGLRHPAISVFIVDGDDTLLQQRAMCKYHTPGLWANACCTHPAVGESHRECAVRRLAEELGVAPHALEERQTLEYRADVGNGMTEHEVVTVFVLEGRPKLSPNPDEVMATRWISLADLERELQKTPAKFTPWLQIYLKKYRQDIFGARSLGGQASNYISVPRTGASAEAGHATGAASTIRQAP